ncbi:MAG: penicillin-binding protein activator, partial [Acidiferrobacterales bacterium]
RAPNIPIYATSNVFTGKVDPTRDTDLDGIMFGDMPWMLVNDGKIQDLRQALERNRPYAHSQLDRLFALGMDSYSIIPHLNRISMEDAARFSGVTSGLSLGRDGRLQRQLLWARFSRGTPKLLDRFIQYTGQSRQIKSDSDKTRAPAPRS